MPRFTIDLHNHSPLIASDYRGPAETEAVDVVRAALDAGIDMLGITDHVSVAYTDRMLDAVAHEAGRSDRHLAVVFGAELKIAWRGEETHLIVLLPQEGIDTLFSDLLSVLGMRGPAGELDHLPTVTIEADPVEVTTFVEGIGGISHVGHADRAFGSYRLSEGPLLRRLVLESRVWAVEALDPEDEDVLRALAGSPLPIIRSSDAHAPGELARRTTELDLDEASFEGLRRYARSVRAADHGSSR